MDNDKELDKELGKKIMGAWHDRAQASKDHLFETDPEKAVNMYRFDPRSMEILGLDEWLRRFGSDD